MKTKLKIKIISAGSLIGAFAVIPAMPSAAIEPPPEEAIPPAAMLEERSQQPRVSKYPAAPKPQEKTAFVGITTGDVPEVLAEHLNLGSRGGIIVRTVLPDSPAEEAGLTVNDIITGIEGKPTEGPQAFSTSIRSRKPGDRLSLDIIHKGKPSTIELMLADRPADAISQMEVEPDTGGMPRSQAEQLRGLIEGNLGNFGLRDSRSFPDSQFEETFRQMRERMTRALGEQIAPGGMGFQQNSTIRVMDADGSVEINSSRGDTEVKVRDKTNNLVWFGPWNSADDKAAAPEDIRERIDRVQAGDGTGFSFRMGRPGGEEDIIEN